MVKIVKNMAKQMFGGLVGTGLVLGVAWLVGGLVHLLETHPIWIIPLFVLDLYLICKEI